jgi:Protein of Unknown function (DUF2784)
MIKDILLKIITFLHIIFVLFVVLTPFTNSNYLLFIHSIFIPFMIIHWICNDNTCVLTIVERKLRKEIYGTNNDDDCITCKLIEPVYDFRKNYQGFTILIYAITISLWMMSSGKLYCKYHDGEIKAIRDLFIV